MTVSRGSLSRMKDEKKEKEKTTNTTRPTNNDDVSPNDGDPQMRAQPRDEEA